MRGGNPDANAGRNCGKKQQANKKPNKHTFYTHILAEVRLGRAYLIKK